MNYRTDSNYLNQQNDIKLLCQKYCKIFEKGLGTLTKIKINLYVNKNKTPKFLNQDL